MGMKTDVVIVGAGPAGCSIAFGLARQGHSVVLIDKKSRDTIGAKVCGDALSPAYYEQLHEALGFPLPDPDYALRCDTLVYQGSNGNHFYIPSNSGTVDRLLYGQQILEELEKFDSVTLLSSTTLKEVIVEGDTVVGVRVIADEPLEIRAKITVDASGVNSVVRKRLPDGNYKFPVSTPRHQRYVAYREIIRFDRPHDYPQQLVISYQPELEELGPSYFWIFARDSHTVNIGLGYTITPQNRGKNIKDINTTIRDRMFSTPAEGNYKILASQGDQIPAALPLPSCVANGLLITGDAACLANPINGEGHGPALLAGISATDVIHAALQTDDVSEKQLWPFNIHVWRHYGKLSAWGIATMQLMDRHSPKIIDEVIDTRIITQKEITTIITDTENSLDMKRIVFRALKHPRMTWKLLTLKRSADRIRSHVEDYPEDPEGFETWNSRLEALV